MEYYVFLLGGLLGYALQLAIIYRLVAGAHYRRYPLLLLYLVGLFLTGVMDLAAYTAVGAAQVSRYARVYYVNNLARQVLAFGVVVSLCLGAARAHPVLERTGRALVVLANAGAMVAFLAARMAPSTLFWNELSRNLSFVATALVMLLWFGLVRSKVRDPVLLLIIGGMGLNLAGDAAGEALIRASRRLVTVGRAMGVISHLLCLCAWLKALGRVNERV